MTYTPAHIQQVRGIKSTATDTSSRTNFLKVRTLFLEKRYKQCASLCEELLQNTKIHPLHKAFLHFYHAISYESLGIAAHKFSVNKIKFLITAQDSFVSALEVLPLPFLTDENGAYSTPRISPLELDFNQATPKQIPTDHEESRIKDETPNRSSSLSDRVSVYSATSKRLSRSVSTPDFKRYSPRGTLDSILARYKDTPDRDQSNNDSKITSLDTESPVTGRNHRSRLSESLSYGHVLQFNLVPSPLKIKKRRKTAIAEESPRQTSQFLPMPEVVIESDPGVETESESALENKTEYVHEREQPQDSEQGRTYQATEKSLPPLPFNMRAHLAATQSGRLTIVPRVLNFNTTRRLPRTHSLRTNLDTAAFLLSKSLSEATAEPDSKSQPEPKLDQHTVLSFPSQVPNRSSPLSAPTPVLEAEAIPTPCTTRFSQISTAFSPNPTNNHLSTYLSSVNLARYNESLSSFRTQLSTHHIPCIRNTIDGAQRVQTERWARKIAEEEQRSVPCHTHDSILGLRNLKGRSGEIESDGGSSIGLGLGLGLGSSLNMPVACKGVRASMETGTITGMGLGKRQFSFWSFDPVMPCSKDFPPPPPVMSLFTSKDPERQVFNTRIINPAKQADITNKKDTEKKAVLGEEDPFADTTSNSYTSAYVSSMSQLDNSPRNYVSSGKNKTSSQQKKPRIQKGNLISDREQTQNNQNKQDSSKRKGRQNRVVTKEKHGFKGVEYYDDLIERIERELDLQRRP